MLHICHVIEVRNSYQLNHQLPKVPPGGQIVKKTSPAAQYPHSLQVLKGCRTQELLKRTAALGGFLIRYENGCFWNPPVNIQKAMENHHV